MKIIIIIIKPIPCNDASNPLPRLGIENPYLASLRYGFRKKKYPSKQHVWVQSNIHKGPLNLSNPTLKNASSAEI